MAWIYSEQDYNGLVDTEYRRYNFFAERGIIFNQQWNSYKANPVLIAGCGYGYLVEELMTNHGFTDVWGCDASQYAVGRAQTELAPQYASRILLGDITSDASIKSVANSAGIKGGNPRFRFILTEDVLPCMDNDAEVQTALATLRGRTQSMAHIITPRMAGSVKNPDGSTLYPGGEQIAGMLWYTHAEWNALINNTSEQKLYTDTYEVVN